MWIGGRCGRLGRLLAGRTVAVYPSSISKSHRLVTPRNLLSITIGLAGVTLLAMLVVAIRSIEIFPSHHDSRLPVWSPTGQQIAYVRDLAPAFESNQEIYVMNADGSGKTRLTLDPRNDFDPVWSPDGQHIAFTSEVSGSWSGGDPVIRVTSADGSSQQELAAGAEAAWSPDGHKIAFAHDGINVMNADGSGKRKLAQDISYYFGWPVWSPDGTKIAFEHRLSRTSDPKIYVMNADGSEQRELVEGGEPTWSPDGTKIAFTDRGDGISVINADSSGLHRLTQDGDSPDWSPDGRMIVFSRDTGPDYQSDIYLIKADGTGEENLTRSPGQSDCCATWSADSRKIAFSDDQNISVINIDGSGRAKLAG
jgi:TolB protein